MWRAGWAVAAVPGGPCGFPVSLPWAGGGEEWGVLLECEHKPWPVVVGVSPAYGR